MPGYQPQLSGGRQEIVQARGGAKQAQHFALSISHPCHSWALLHQHLLQSPSQSSQGREPGDTPHIPPPTHTRLELMN